MDGRIGEEVVVRTCATFYLQFYVKSKQGSGVKGGGRPGLEGLCQAPKDLRSACNAALSVIFCACNFYESFGFGTPLVCSHPLIKTFRMPVIYMLK